MSTTPSTSQPSQSTQQQHHPQQVFGYASLFVGDLEESVTEGQLYDLFEQFVTVVSTRVCRDHHTKVSLGYGYVNFRDIDAARHAMEILNFTPVNGKPIRIMFSHRDPITRKSGHANLFIKNLDPSIDNKKLYDMFAVFGTVRSCKVETYSNGQSKGYGYVQFEKEEASEMAIRQLNGKMMDNKTLYVAPHVRKHERGSLRNRNQANGSQKFTNVYVKNFSETTTDEDLKKVFGSYGSITSAIVMRDDTGSSKGFGFVNFQNPDDAANAVEKLNGTTVSDDKIWYVTKALNKSEREAELRANFEKVRNGESEKLQGANLYLKNLDDSINDESLKDLFSEFGCITSCKVMLDPHGQSRGSGFVAFSTSEEANRAVSEMNGKMIGRKPLYVAVAQHKENRKARLQAHFAQIRGPVNMAPVPSGVIGFHHWGPRIAPQRLYLGQGAHGLPPQFAYGFQQQLLPGIRPGVAPNFIVPYPIQRQGRPRQRMRARRDGTPQQMQPHMQMLNHNANQGFRYMPNLWNGAAYPSMVPQGLMRPMVAMPLGQAGLPVSMNGQPGPTLASVLASASPKHQQQMLGEQLFPLVDRLEHDHAGKVTGMLLEMDQTEVLHLIEAPDALRKKVGEAMNVLRLASSGSDAADQLGS
ncbi:Polyadenylate-binding protein [Thalictrum thalictroides]|uniref:Polyadenylate-binding protein n=1 Tax=Thalictrum thalictroides TaxID=46969 RepID=A0A7J6XHW7_THATH|nr:Polyadenylate-binding protein [Thalictrum thalictroides]